MKLGPVNAELTTDRTKGRIELAVVGTDGDRAKQIENSKLEGGSRVALDNTGIIEKMLENGLPVTQHSIGIVQRAIKHIHYLLVGGAPPPEYPMQAYADLINVPLGELVKWLLEMDKADGLDETATIEGEMLSLHLEELRDAKPEDIIRLVKHGVGITLSNIVLAKNLRENKGFPDILLKLFFNRTEDKRQEIEPVDIKLLLKSTEKGKNKVPRQWAAAELLAQRTALLDRVLVDQNLWLFPFLFKGEYYGCTIKAVGNRDNGKGRQDEVLELYMETSAPHLGRIKVHIRKSQSDLQCSFFVDRDETKDLIDRQRNLLRNGLERSGFDVSKIECFIKQTIKPGAVEKSIDLKV